MGPRKTPCWDPGGIMGPMGPARATTVRNSPVILFRLAILLALTTLAGTPTLAQPSAAPELFVDVSEQAGIADTPRWDLVQVPGEVHQSRLYLHRPGLGRLRQRRLGRPLPRWRHQPQHALSQRSRWHLHCQHILGPGGPTRHLDRGSGVGRLRQRRLQGPLRPRQRRQRPVPQRGGTRLHRRHRGYRGGRHRQGQHGNLGRLRRRRAPRPVRRQLVLLSRVPSHRTRPGQRPALPKPGGRHLRGRFRSARGGQAPGGRLRGQFRRLRRRRRSGHLRGE